MLETQVRNFGVISWNQNVESFWNELFHLKSFLFGIIRNDPDEFSVKIHFNAEMEHIVYIFFVKLNVNEYFPQNPYEPAVEMTKFYSPSHTFSMNSVKPNLHFTVSELIWRFFSSEKTIFSFFHTSCKDLYDTYDKSNSQNTKYKRFEEFSVKSDTVSIQQHLYH